MSGPDSYAAVMQRREQILLAATGLDYAEFERRGCFSYEALMASVGLGLDQVRAIQRASGVGDTPLVELSNITKLVRARAAPGKGARIFVKDEAANPSGSFKDRRASISAYYARERGYEGLIAATSGNYGAGLASQAARYGLRSIVIQEAFDGVGRGQPEILEKGRKCEALGAEVLQTTVGPELFFMLLLTLEQTGYFNASLYTPFSIAGVETLGVEIAEQTRRRTGRDPALVLATHAGGGMVTGTARGLRAGGAAATGMVGVSVDLRGLHMASDRDFNRKSFTTGHTGFSVPFTGWPDRVDVPRNAARPLRYLDRFVTVTQGEVFFATELLARTEGLERGPAGNISLAAAIPLAAELDADEVVVISETEYTGAGKSPVPQLTFAREIGVELVNGDAALEEPGVRIALPISIESLRVGELRLDDLRSSYVQRAIRQEAGVSVESLVEETGWDPVRVGDELAGQMIDS
ncbi:MAG: PLP-dependent lyase/thiolase [Actinobacteria bacterium]|nr:PLP-dependent lyase/thiolase [Actinomycetota bacterium]